MIWHSTGVGGFQVWVGVRNGLVQLCKILDCSRWCPAVVGELDLNPNAMAPLDSLLLIAENE